MDKSIKIDLKIKSEMPLHIGTGIGKNGVIDKCIIKRGDGTIYIPGSSIKGRIKHYYKYLYSTFVGPLAHDENEYCTNIDIKQCCATCQIFGSVFHQGRLIFSDSELEQPKFRGFDKRVINEFLNEFQSTFRSNTKISRRRKVTEEKHLFTLEATMPGLTFSSTIEGYLSISDQELAVFLASIKMFDKIGGGKTKGLGRVKTEFSTSSDGKEINNYLDQLIRE